MNGFVVIMFSGLGLAMLLGILDITAQNHARYLAEELRAIETQMPE